MVTFDATILLALLEPTICIPKYPNTTRPVEKVSERLALLIASLEKHREKIIIPTPALSEILVRAGPAGPSYMEKFAKASPFRVVDFDTRAAVQYAAMIAHAIEIGDKKSGVDDTWAKVKFDRQIVAIAKVEGCQIIYSDDSGVKSFANQNGMTVITVSELPLPPEDSQQKLPL
jgi:hypothetical protein